MRAGLTRGELRQGAGRWAHLIAVSQRAGLIQKSEEASDTDFVIEVRHHYYLGFEKEQ
jgi:hypothetical protein